jgi:small subunit ribosomal protein S6
MRFYECVFIARQDLTNAQVENLAQHYTSVIKERGGQVGKIEFCGLRNLAYRIKKNKKGHYVLMNVTAEPSAVAEIERLMKLNEDVLRYLSVRVEQLEDNPSPLMQQRTFRDEKKTYDDVDLTDVAEEQGAQ